MCVIQLEMRGGSCTPSALRYCQRKELKKLAIKTAAMALAAALDVPRMGQWQWWGGSGGG
jgi:hypothetical protein